MNKVTKLFPNSKPDGTVQYGKFRGRRITNSDLKKSTPKIKKHDTRVVSKVPWDKFLVPILISAIIFGMAMNLVSYALFNDSSLFENGINFTKIGFLSCLMFLPGSSFLIWLISKMTDIFE